MKTYKQRSTVDLFKVTPYAKFHKEFIWAAQNDTKYVSWQAKVWTQWSKNHHFKWHRGLAENLHGRVVRDSGNCKLDVNEDNCVPKFQFWKEVARQYAAVSAEKGFNLTKLGCQEGIDTQWNW